MLVGSVVIAGEPWDRPWGRPSFSPSKPIRHDVRIPIQSHATSMEALVGCLVEVRLTDGTTGRFKVLAVEPPMLQVGPAEWIGLASIVTIKKVGFSDAELADMKAIGLTLDDFRGDPRHDAHRQ